MILPNEPWKPKTRKQKLLYYGGITAIMLIIGGLVFSSFVAVRVWTQESCSTWNNYPTTINVVAIVDRNQNLTGKQLAFDQWYVVCQSHPDYKAFGCRDYPCVTDNGTHVKVGSQTWYIVNTSEGVKSEWHDGTWWEPKTAILGEQIYKTELLQGTEIIIVTLLALISISIAIFCIYMFSSTNSLEKSEALK
jgi:hypothetical protein